MENREPSETELLALSYIWRCNGRDRAARRLRLIPLVALVAVIVAYLLAK